MSIRGLHCLLKNKKAGEGRNEEENKFDALKFAFRPPIDGSSMPSFDSFFSLSLLSP